MTISAGLGIANFPFADSRTFWRWVDLCDNGGVDSLWQSDRMYFAGEPVFDSVRISVKPFEGSDLQLREDGSIFARGVSGGPLPSPYVLEAVIRDIEACP